RCRARAAATSGAGGLLARAVTALARLTLTTGSRVSPFSGIGGGPDGFPLVTEPRAISTFGLLMGTALLPEFSSRPLSIHLRRTSMWGSGILGDLGGMKGSRLWATAT